MLCGKFYLPGETMGVSSLEDERCRSKVDILRNNHKKISYNPITPPTTKTRMLVQS